MPLDMAAAAAYVNQHQAESTSGRRDLLNYDFRPGQNRGRLLPPWPGSGDLAMHVWHHTKCPPRGDTHFFCWENMLPGRGIECPMCSICKKLRALLGNDSGIWKQEAWDSPRTNWIDRQPVHPQTRQPLPLDQNPGPYLIDLNIRTFNYLMSTAVQTGCDLTSTDLGYDIIISYDKSAKKKDAYTTAVMPGAAQPLAPTPELSKLWLDNMYDIRALVKIPNWQDAKGKAEWEKICSSARELERMYLQGSGAVQGFGPGQHPPVGQYPQQQQMPQFTQPTAGVPTAPPPQFAQPGMMGAPGAVPFGQPFGAPPAAPMPPSAPPMPPPPMAAAPAPPAPPPPYAAPMAPPPPPVMAQPASTGFTPPPPMPPAMPQQPVAPPVDNRPPWEQGQPPIQTSPFPPQPPNLGVTAQSPPAGFPSPTPPPVPPQPPPAPPSPGPSMVNTSADGKPVCFAHSRLDLSVEHGATGQAPVKGGYSEDAAEVGYRCMMCPQQLECSSKAQATYPEHYAKDANNVYVMPKTA